MTILHQFSGLWAVHALGWTLLHFCWQGALVAVALWCVLGLLRRQSQLRYAAACCGLALMVALPVATFAHLAPAARRASMQGMVVRLELDTTVTADGSGTVAEPFRDRIAHALDDAAPWVPAVWLAGVVLFLVRLSFGLAAARRMKSGGTLAPPLELQQMFDGLRVRLGVARAVRLLHSAMVQVPTVIGWLRPVVLIPVSCLTGLSATQIEAVLCHELAHIRRHDYLVSVFQSVVEALLFYHPAVWWVSRQIRRERECCCDELAVAVGGDVLAYARALSTLEERRAFSTAIVLGANGGVLKMRIKRLLGSNDGAAVSQLPAILLLAIMVAGACIGIARAEPKERTDAVKRLLGLRTAEPIATEAMLAPADILPMQAGPHKFVVSARMEDPNAGFAAAENAARIFAPPQVHAAQAQGDGGIEGTVFDPVGAVIRKAKVTSTNTDTGVQMVRETDDAGKYSLSPLPAGPYNVEVEARGFQRLLQENVRIGAAEHVGLNLKLTVGGATESMTVTGNSSAGAAGPQAQGAGAARAPMLVSSGVMAKQTISQPPPVYPDIAKAAHVQGVVVLHAIISKTGTVESLTVISGPPMLTSSALDAVRLWTYRPYLLNGQPIAVETTVNVNYTFGGDGAAPPPPPLPDGAGTVPQAAPGRPLRVSSGTIAGLVISQPSPVYPADAKAAHVQGVVVLHALISKTGEIENLQVVSGPMELVGSAIDAVRQWKYKPYLLNGEPTEVETTINVNYTLGEDAPLMGNSMGNGRGSGLDSGNGSGLGAGTGGEFGGGLRKIGGDVSAPLLIYMVDPEYTPEARKAKFEGVVLVNLIVDQRGVPQNVHLVRGVGMGLDMEAIEAVKKYRFKPAMEDGQPVPVELNVEVNFKIFDGPPQSQNAAPMTDAAGNLVRKIGGDVTAPMLIYKVDPQFTPEAKAAKVEGTVLVNLIVNEDGKPENVHLVRGVGHGLDLRAIVAVKQYRFKPAMENGKPVPVDLNVEVNFTLF